ncbi:Hypothetical predicted protein, partial [Pelobates cultripes]
LVAIETELLAGLPSQATGLDQLNLGTQVIPAHITDNCSPIEDRSEDMGLLLSGIAQLKCESVFVIFMTSLLVDLLVRLRFVYMVDYVFLKIVRF